MFNGKTHALWAHECKMHWFVKKISEVRDFIIKKSKV